MKKLTNVQKFDIEFKLLKEWLETHPPEVTRDMGHFEKWRKERIKERGLKLK